MSKASGLEVVRATGAAAIGIRLQPTHTYPLLSLSFPACPIQLDPRSHNLQSTASATWTSLGEAQLVAEAKGFCLLAYPTAKLLLTSFHLTGSWLAFRSSLFDHIGTELQRPEKTLESPATGLKPSLSLGLLSPSRLGLRLLCAAPLKPVRLAHRTLVAASTRDLRITVDCPSSSDRLCHLSLPFIFTGRPEFVPLPLPLPAIHVRTFVAPISLFVQLCRSAALFS